MYNSHKDTRVKVIHLIENLYDIFWGYGWDNWCRVRIITRPEQKTQFLKQSGFDLPFYARIGVSKYLKLTI